MFTIHFRLLLCPLSELGRPIQLIRQITFATKCDFITVPFFSLRPCAARSSGTNQTLRLTGLSTLFKASYLPTKFCPPREVLTSSENRMMRVKIFFSAFWKLPDSYPNGQRWWEEENDFAFPFCQLNQHLFHPSVPIRAEMLISISPHPSMGKVEDDKYL